VLNVNAMLAFEEGGISPFSATLKVFAPERRDESDKVGFGSALRMTLPYSKPTLWVTRLSYLPGRNPRRSEERMKGHGKRCLAQLSSTLLRRTKSICLTVNQRKADTVKFYVKAGSTSIASTKRSISVNKLFESLKLVHSSPQIIIRLCLLLTAACRRVRYCRNIYAGDSMPLPKLDVRFLCWRSFTSSSARALR
jgi:hypothetical protein